MDRVILHSDANCFYAGVEMLYHPELRLRPMAVGGTGGNGKNGIILTANYPAKHRGVKTGMALWQAYEACPSLTVLPPRMDEYLRFSGYLREIYTSYTDLVEPFGCDEAWLDVTDSRELKGDGLKIAEEIRNRVKAELGITVSVGVSFNKILAKLGSDYKKPDAVTTMLRCEFRKKAWSLPAADLLMVGRSTRKTLEKMGIRTIGQIARTPAEVLELHLGKMGLILWSFANGLDESPVRADGEHGPVKSIGNSITTPRPILDDGDAKVVLFTLAESVGARLRRHGFRARTVELYVRDTNLNSCTRQRKLRYATDSTCELAAEAFRLFLEHRETNTPYRSLGIRGADLVLPGFGEQLDLFTDDGFRERLRAADRTVDEIRRHFGYYAVQRGIALTECELSHLNAEEDHSVHPMGYFG